ncbi:hypothetical protein [Brevibacillus migulae]|uniref:hypothetical protein n=1 Tax=Brevibacillus migulae TaxID=1644114 RepID=UPI00106E226E|nr:hypothetical protein [Brevibacillus migulae]
MIQRITDYFVELGFKVIAAFFLFGLTAIGLTTILYYWLTNGYDKARSQVTDPSLFDAMNIPLAKGVSSIIPYLYAIDIIWISIAWGMRRFL